MRGDTNSKRLDGGCDRMLKNKKTWMITLGTVGAATAIAFGAAAIWNSRQMRLMRAAKRTSKLLYRVGSAMQAVSGMVEGL